MEPPQVKVMFMYESERIYDVLIWKKRMLMSDFLPTQPAVYVDVV